jgi:hypothetical protein
MTDHGVGAPGTNGALYGGARRYIPGYADECRRPPCQHLTYTTGQLARPARTPRRCRGAVDGRGNAGGEQTLRRFFRLCGGLPYRPGAWPGRARRYGRGEKVLE